VAALASSFVPVADEVGRLQRGEDAECRFFQVLAEQGHYAGRTQPSNTRQGIYAATPGGELLASINTRDARAMERMLRQALARWDELDRERRLGPRTEGDARESAPAPRRWESRYPEDGLVLRVVARDLERDASAPAPPADWRADAWNQDFAWFSREELAALIPAEPRPRLEQPWPDALVRRLARCHLVDDVRGQVPAFPADAIERAELVARVAAVDPEAGTTDSGGGGRLVLELHGSVRSAARGRWAVEGFQDREHPVEQERGIEVELLGRAELEGERFVAFELVAVGTRWGGTQFNGRGDDLRPAPIGFSLTLAGSGPSDRVAPALVWEYGWAPPR